MPDASDGRSPTLLAGLALPLPVFRYRQREASKSSIPITLHLDLTIKVEPGIVLAKIPTPQLMDSSISASSEH